MKNRVTVLFLFLILLLSPVMHAEPVRLADLPGRWQLLYRGNYGYQFQFFKNFRAICTVYLNTSAVIFKGVYTIEDGNKIRINVNEMKNESKAHQMNKFVKTSSTYFIFDAKYEQSKKSKVLELVPIRSIIDGNNSEGYFEPLIKLNKID